MIGLMRNICIGVLSLVFVGAASGQDASIVVDTLNWQRYYPLEIGNTWEYGGLDSYISTIVGDTLVQDHHYFIRRDSIPPNGTLASSIHTFYVRYDTAGTVVTVNNLEADTLEIPVAFHQIDLDVSFLMRFDLRTAFGDTLYSGGPDTLYMVRGGYNETRQIGSQLVEVDAMKCIRGFGFTAGAVECYAADIGFVGGGNLFTSELNYARVGGIEYGRLSTTTEGTNSPTQFSIETVYPNPFKHGTTVTYRLANPSPITIEIFNIAGQQIYRKNLPIQTAGIGRYALKTKQWPAGVYFVRLTTDNGEQSMRPILLAK